MLCMYLTSLWFHIFFIVAGKLSRKRSTAGLKAQEGDRAMEVSSYKCYFTDCTPPPDPDTIPPVCTTPATAVQWSASEWTLDADGYVTNVETGSGTRGEPVAGEKVKIAKGIVNCILPFKLCPPAVKNNHNF